MYQFKYHSVSLKLETVKIDPEADTENEMFIRAQEMKFSKFFSQSMTLFLYPFYFDFMGGQPSSTFPKSCLLQRKFTFLGKNKKAHSSHRIDFYEKIFCTALSGYNIRPMKLTA